MIKIAICDDEELYCKRIMESCQQYFLQKWQDSQIEYSFTLYTSGEEFLQGDVPDLLFLDIEMPGINGIQIKELLQRRRTKTRILYITSHPEVVREAFGFQVFGFLEKPLDYQTFCKKLDVAVLDILASDREVCYRELGIPRRVKLSDIRYIKAARYYSYLYLEGQAEARFADESIGRWEKELAGEYFVRCHYSYMVNAAFIHKYDKNKIILHTGEEVPMSRRRSMEVREVYLNYIRDNAR